MSIHHRRAELFEFHDIHDPAQCSGPENSLIESPESAFRWGWGLSGVGDCT